MRLIGAQIGGNLECDGGTFTNPSAVALSADGIDVKGGVFFRQGFTAEGEVRLPGAQVGRDLSCVGGKFKNNGGDALSADHISVKGSVFLREGFTAEGKVRLLGAQIGGDLDCIGGMFTTLVAQTVTIKGNLFWSEVRNPQREHHDVPSGSTGTVSALHQARSGFTGRLDLRNASVGALLDDEERWPESWPDTKQGGTLLLDGFVYQRFSGGLTDAPKRLQWLKRQRYFWPQPYRQLAKVLREGGDDRGARRVLYEMERLRRAEEDRGWPSKSWRGLLKLTDTQDPQSAIRWVLALLVTFLSKSWGRLLKSTIGYGYYPQWAFWWLLAVVALGGWLFWMGYNHRAMAPAEKVAYASFHDQGVRPHDYEHFHPLVYSLKNSFPLVKLGQADKWSPDPADTECPGCNGLPDRVRYCARSWSCGLRWFRWGQICAGWVLATLFVAGVTGVVRKE